MNATKTHHVGLVVTAESGSGERTVHQFESGRSVLVGTSKDCGLRLQGEGLSACHCLLSLEDGTLWVQDWASHSGTLLNGQPIEAKVAVERTDEIRVGEYRLSTAPVSAGAFGACQSVASSHSEPPRCEAPQAPQSIRNEEPKTLQTPAEAAMWTEDELLNGLEVPVTGNPQTAFEAESFEQETIALLRDEIELLQEMLAQRDAQLAERNAAADEPGAPNAATIDDGDSEALLARMEQLLEEAACGDERVALLEEMLQAAEEANQAEQEERRQLEAWVGDIERRISQRDGQRNAEVEALRGRLEEAVQEREQAQLQLKQAASVGNAPQYYEESLDRLQQQNKALQDKLAEMAAERASLMQQLDQSGARDDEALREERVAIAQERAIVSRLRSELTNKLSALEDSPKPANPAASDAATRLQALREHLREIHAEEQQECHEPTSHSLTSRISRIWKRLEN